MKIGLQNGTKTKMSNLLKHFKVESNQNRVQTEIDNYGLKHSNPQASKQNLHKAIRLAE